MLAAWLLAAGPMAASAANLSVTIDACSGVDDTQYASCTSAIYLDGDKRADGDNALFRQAFEAWNAGNPAGSAWTLKNGGALPGGALTVGIFDAIAETESGGLEFQINWSYTGADRADFRWVQGLKDNYDESGNIGASSFELDVKAEGCDNSALDRQCPPLYPFQYADSRFYDKPDGPWPNGSFDAVFLLSKADFAARELTVYEGVSWGFALSAAPIPEPSTYLMLALGLGLIGVQRLRNT
jgi:hypothetical protein